MLQQIFDTIHNYFIKEAVVGTYAIADGMISLPFVQDGQRFWITNSVFNDGVYTYHEDGIKDDDDAEAAGLKDETWAGTICALAVPPAVIALSSEIKAWVEANSEIVNSPFVSENVIGVYSYSRAVSGNGNPGSNAKAVGWQDIFADRLNRWRKVSL